MSMVLRKREIDLRVDIPGKKKVRNGATMTENNFDDVLKAAKILTGFVNRKTSIQRRMNNIFNEVFSIPESVKNQIRYTHNKESEVTKKLFYVTEYVYFIKVYIDGKLRYCRIAYESKSEHDQKVLTPQKIATFINPKKLECVKISVQCDEVIIHTKTCSIPYAQRIYLYNIMLNKFLILLLGLPENGYFNINEEYDNIDIIKYYIHLLDGFCNCIICLIVA